MMNVKELREHWLEDKAARDRIVLRFMEKLEANTLSGDAEYDFMIKFIAEDCRTLRWFVENTLRVLEEHEQRFGTNNAR